MASETISPAGAEATTAAVATSEAPPTTTGATSTTEVVLPTTTAEPTTAAASIEGNTSASLIEPADQSGERKTPFAHPASSVSIPAPAPLTTEQETKYNSLHNTVSSWTDVTSEITLTEVEQQWLTRECLLRYLRASSWDTGTACKRLRSTVLWRREFGLHDKLSAEYVAIENETGKQWILGYDNAGRPCQYLNPSRQNTERSDRQIEHLVFMLERSLDLLPPGQETLALLINFAETRSGQGASIAQGRQTLNILQNHYPERLGRALLCNLPWHISTFMRLILPFVDPITRAKIIFNQPMRDHVPAEQLRISHGGDLAFEYEHAKYWPALIQLAAERRQAQHQRWIKGGKRIGEFEGYLKGVLDVGVAGEKHAEVGSSENGGGSGETNVLAGETTPAPVKERKNVVIADGKSAAHTDEKDAGHADEKPDHANSKDDDLIERDGETFADAPEESANATEAGEAAEAGKAIEAGETGEAEELSNGVAKLDVTSTA